MAGIAGDFMTNWQSESFRSRIVAQIQGARESSNPDPESPDRMEQFLAQNTCEQLEEFIFQRSQYREDYLSLTAELLMSFRQCKGRPGQGRENLNGDACNGDALETSVNGGSPNTSKHDAQDAANGAPNTKS